MSKHEEIIDKLQSAIDTLVDTQQGIKLLSMASTPIQSYKAFKQYIIRRQTGLTELLQEINQEIDEL